MGGIRVKADEEGIALLNAWADGIDEGADNIVDQTESLLDDVSQYSALGPHKKSIENMIAMIQEETKSASSPARVVAERARKKGKEYQEWIDDALVGDGGGN